MTRPWGLPGCAPVGERHCRGFVQGRKWLLAVAWIRVERWGGRSEVRIDSGPCALAGSTIRCRSVAFRPGGRSEPADHRVRGQPAAHPSRGGCPRRSGGPAQFEQIIGSGRPRHVPLSPRRSSAPPSGWSSSSRRASRPWSTRPGSSAPTPARPVRSARSPGSGVMAARSVRRARATPSFTNRTSFTSPSWFVLLRRTVTRTPSPSVESTMSAVGPAQARSPRCAASRP